MAFMYREAPKSYFINRPGQYGDVSYVLANRRKARITRCPVKFDVEARFIAQWSEILLCEDKSPI